MRRTTVLKRDAEDSFPGDRRVHHGTAGRGGAMHRTTIMLPRTLELQCKRHSRRKGISLAEFVRQSLERELREDDLANDPLFTDLEVYKGPAPKDGAANHDKYLYGDDM